MNLGSDEGTELKPYLAKGPRANENDLKGIQNRGTKVARIASEGTQ